MSVLDERKSRNQIVFALLIVPFLTSLPVLAEPPPGTPEVTNNFCAVWNGGTGVCDDYNFAHDLTPSSEWVRARYEFEMHNTSTITMTLEWEMHEFNRSAIGLEDMDLGGLFDFNNSGAPADYIRNYLGFTTPQGMQVRQMMLNEFSSSVEELVNNTYGGSAEVESTIVNQVNIEGQNIQCTDDMDADSIDEIYGLGNNAFQPPLCFRSVAEVEIGSGLFNLTATPLNLERAFEGLLLMGAELSSDFTLVSKPGHRSSFELIPPNYATFTDVGGNGTLVPQQQGSVHYNSASWLTDGISLQGSESTYYDASITSIYRNTTTHSVFIDPAIDKALSIEMVVDLRDESNNLLIFDADIHYLPQSVLGSWGFTMGDSIELPWITSDGIRMGYEYGLLELANFSSMIPMDDLNAAISNATDVDLEMSEIYWKEPDSSGGLNFTHIPNFTCSELIAVTHCLSGANAMNSTFPVTLTSMSDPFSFSLLDKLTDLLNDQPELENLTEIPEEDVAAILSVLVFEHGFNSSFISDSMPSWIPSTEVEITILLPDWVASNIGDSRSITLSASTMGGEEQTISLTGPNPYHNRWNDPICRGSGVCSESSLDLICPSTQRTCIGIHAELDFPKFEIHEWSQEIELTVEGEISVELYRVAVPAVLTDDFGLTIEAIPSDLIRHFVAFGDEQDGGLNGLLGKTIDVPLGEQTHQLELSNNGLQAFANSLANMLNDEVSGMEQSDDMVTVDLSGIHFSASVPQMERPYDGIIDDDSPIKFTLALDNTVISARYVDGGVTINTEQGVGMMTPLFSDLFSIFDFRAASDSGGIVTLPPDPLEVEVEPITIVEDVDESKDSDEDGDMNNDPDLDVRPSIVLELSMPRGLEVELSSSMGRAEKYVIDGDRKKIIYYVPLCIEENPNDCDAQSDELSIQFTIGYAFLLQELMPYIIGLLILIFLFFYRRSRKKKKKREKLEAKLLKKRAVNVNTFAVERDLLDLEPTNLPASPDTDWLTGLDLDGEDW
ncbi:MAG: hypothetical protein QF566_02730 [Candidatus Thalassarchaeaceae archaeon]|nr:hypothetical protein [Candidatus Thalassarchaeaceae archaeon]